MVVRMETREARSRTRVMVFSRTTRTRMDGLMAASASHMLPAPRKRPEAASMVHGTSNRSNRSRIDPAALMAMAGMNIRVTAYQPNRFSEALNRAEGSCWLRIRLRPSR